MPLRKIILRVLLGSLAISAIAGATAVLFVDADVLWQIIGTGITTAVGSLFLLAMTRLLDKPKSHVSGLLGICLVILECILVLALIWEVGDGYSSRVEEMFIFLFLTFPVTGALSMIALVFLKHPPARWTSLAIMGSSAVAQIFFIIGAIGQVAPFRDDPWWETGWTILGYGILIAICLLGCFGKNQSPPKNAWQHWHPWPGIMTALTGAGLAIASICGMKGEAVPLFAGATIMACLWAYSTLVLQAKLKPGQRLFGIGTIAVLSVTGLCLELITLDDFVSSSLKEGLARIAAATGILGACGSLALAIMTTLNRRGQHLPADGESLSFSEVELFCPHCRTRQTLPLGKACCKKCHLPIEINVQEPRCEECDYLLVGLTCDSCPECGKIIK